LEEEAYRIVKKNGRVSKYMDNSGHYKGPLRVWTKNGKVPGLAVTRSFGDQLAHTIGVICEPEIT
jgi:hypothetical protein